MVSSEEPNPRGLEADPRWRERQQYWQRRFGKIRLGDEPLDEAVRRVERVTWTLTAIVGGIALAIVAILAAFGNVLVGLILGALVATPALSVAWFDYLSFKRKVARYEQERREFEAEKELGP